MPTFPIPVFVACILAFMSLRLWQKSDGANPLVLLLVLCSLQSLIIALSQHYGFESMRFAQPLTASLIPPAALIAYRGALSEVHIAHILGPILVVLMRFIAPQFIDVLLPGLFLFYGGVILISAMQGPNGQANAPLSFSDLTARIWIVIGVALIASAFSDVLIVASNIFGYPQFKPWIISIFSVGNLLIVGALGLSPYLQTIIDDHAHEPPPEKIPDRLIWKRITTYMKEQKPYLDPDLTLARLSRKLCVPAKSLSETINLSTGENVSRFINQARIKEAQGAMLKGESVTSAMLRSGFNTKSNFNREFLRITGVSPTAWLSDARASDDTPTP